MPAPYPKPKENGGHLIRNVIGTLRRAEIGLPISSYILCAVSGGADSIALAHLLVHYGRRLAPRGKIGVVHINHGWRGKESDEDAEFVAACAAAWDVPCEVIRLDSQPKKGESWEAHARQERKRHFLQLAQERQAQILTAHHADDLAETVLWRILSGTAETHGGGILLQDGPILRPLLQVRREALRAYLREEGQTWREDSTNAQDRFLRARLRQRVMPELEAIFPRAIEHLVQLGINVQAQGRARHVHLTQSAIGALLGASGVTLRRPHWEAYREKAQDSRWEGSIDLPGGWKLSKAPKP